MRDLLAQQKEGQLPVDFWIFEDGSTAANAKNNEWLRNEPLVNYTHLAKNNGRSAIRNTLARAASASYLLFLDDDSLPVNHHFLKDYCEQLTNGEVICGGRQYEVSQPSDHYSLHWKYGTTMESKSAETRNENPYLSFHSNNFLVKKELLLAMPFDDQLKQYGHEDTLFGVNLNRNKISIKHIHNPVWHKRLESNKDFLNKTERALENLRRLQLQEDSFFEEHVNLLMQFNRLTRWQLKGIYSVGFRLFKARLQKYLLKSKQPNLLCFNLYKLGCFIELN